MVGKLTTPKTPKTPKASNTPKRTPKSAKRKEPPISSNKQLAEGNETVGGTPENEPKRAKQQPDLMNFFKPKDKPAPPRTVPQCMPDGSRFTNYFQIKDGMKLAPVLMRKPLTDNERTTLLDTGCEELSYLKQCKLIKKKPASNTDELKAKYFHFHKNYRPPYYGTWRRRSATVNGRRPFDKQEKTLNYEYDSDEDWEEDPADADECKSDEDEEKDEPLSEDDDEEGFFVPHGYLSTDEGSGAEEDDLLMAEGKKKPANGQLQSGIDEEKKTPTTGGVDEDEQRRQRLDQKAEEWKDQQRQKERRNKKRQLIPTVYLPEENAIHHPVLHKYILPGVLFDYSTIVVVKPPTVVPTNDGQDIEAVENTAPIAIDAVVVPTADLPVA